MYFVYICLSSLHDEQFRILFLIFNFITDNDEKPLILSLRSFNLAEVHTTLLLTWLFSASIFFEKSELVSHKPVQIFWFFKKFTIIPSQAAMSFLKNLDINHLVFNWSKFYLVSYIGIIWKKYILVSLSSLKVSPKVFLYNSYSWNHNVLCCKLNAHDIIRTCILNEWLGYTACLDNIHIL